MGLGNVVKEERSGKLYFVMPSPSFSVMTFVCNELKFIRNYQGNKNGPKNRIAGGNCLDLINSCDISYFDTANSFLNLHFCDGDMLSNKIIKLKL